MACKSRFTSSWKEAGQKFRVVGPWLGWMCYNMNHKPPSLTSADRKLEFWRKVSHQALRPNKYSHSLQSYRTRHSIYRLPRDAWNVLTGATISTCWWPLVVPPLTFYTAFSSSFPFVLLPSDTPVQIDLVPWCLLCTECSCPPTFICQSTIPNVMVFGDEASGRWSGLAVVKVSPPWLDYCPHKKRHKRAFSPSFHHVKIQREDGHLENRKQALTCCRQS